MPIADNIMSTYSLVFYFFFYAVVIFDVNEKIPMPFCDYNQQRGTNLVLK